MHQRVSLKGQHAGHLHAETVHAAPAGLRAAKGERLHGGLEALSLLRLVCLPPVTTTCPSNMPSNPYAQHYAHTTHRSARKIAGRRGLCTSRCIAHAGIKQRAQRLYKGFPRSVQHQMVPTGVHSGAAGCRRGTPASFRGRRRLCVLANRLGEHAALLLDQVGVLRGAGRGTSRKRLVLQTHLSCKRG